MTSQTLDQPLPSRIFSAFNHWHFSRAAVPCQLWDRPSGGDAALRHGAPSQTVEQCGLGFGSDHLDSILRLGSISKKPRKFGTTNFSALLDYSALLGSWRASVLRLTPVLAGQGETAWSSDASTPSPFTCTPALRSVNPGASTARAWRGPCLGCGDGMAEGINARAQSRLSFHCTGSKTKPGPTVRSNQPAAPFLN